MAKPFVVAPAMNTHMWSHPFTKRHIEAIESIGCLTIQPISKTLACGDIGYGALATVDEIVSVTLKSLSLNGQPDSIKFNLESTHELWCYSPVFLCENDPRREMARQKLDDEHETKHRGHQYLALVDEASHLSFFFAVFNKDSGLITKICNATQIQDHDAEKIVDVPGWVISKQWVN
mmetsp:Transcript_20377/g.24684  ORF Transcript_20377/g.24684 Transcript_20377/m.24684 type:complete len:177 (-) Transcript_20377:1126-1656(-)